MIGASWAWVWCLSGICARPAGKRRARMLAGSCTGTRAAGGPQAAHSVGRLSDQRLPGSLRRGASCCGSAGLGSSAAAGLSGSTVGRLLTV